MLAQYRIFSRRGVYYAEDRSSGHQTSLRTRCRVEANQIIAAKNQAAAQPVLNLTMARAYLTASSPEMMTRTWLDVMKEIETGYADSESSLKRWRKFMRSEPMEALVNVPLLMTENTQLLAAMRHKRAGVSVNKYLRMVHNRALDMGWLLAPVLARKMWPKFRYKNRRAITEDEHRKIVAAEHLTDYRLYYELIWCTGGTYSQSRPESIRFNSSTKHQRRRKSGLQTHPKSCTSPVHLRVLPKKRPLFACTAKSPRAGRIRSIS